MNEKYEKIINLSHHVSPTRAPMPIADRAAQFAPYSALSGYEDAVEETARLTDSKIELDDYEKERINDILIRLSDAPLDTRITATYFRADRHKTGGAYINLSGEFAYIDEVERELVLTGGSKIRIDDIIEISIF